MAQLKKKYVDINDTLRHIRLQVRDGQQWVNENVPFFKSPVDMYHWMRVRTTYENDPHDTELIHNADSLFNDNFHGKPGHGDCDDFAMLTLSVAQKQKWKYPLWIKLAGRNREYPVHIWAGYDIDGKEFPMDLTERKPGDERKYKYIQKIYFKHI